MSRVREKEEGNNSKLYITSLVKKETLKGMSFVGCFVFLLFFLCSLLFCKFWVLLFCSGVKKMISDLEIKGNQEAVCSSLKFNKSDF